MESEGWIHLRTEQHQAFPGMSVPLEIHRDTLAFRMRIQDQIFMSRDVAEVYNQARAYLLKQSMPGEWQPMIELALYSGEMRANRYYILVEENGTILRHPWVETPKAIVIGNITSLSHHRIECGKKAPPCMHHEGLSSYYHWPYTLEVWKRVQELVRTFNRFFVRHTAFLKTVSTPHQTWETHFLEQWDQASLFKIENNGTGEKGL